MKLKIKELRFLTGRPVCMIHEKTAEEIDREVYERLYDGNLKPQQ